MFLIGEFINKCHLMSALIRTLEINEVKNPHLYIIINDNTCTIEAIFLYVAAVHTGNFTLLRCPFISNCR